MGTHVYYYHVKSKEKPDDPFIGKNFRFFDGYDSDGYSVEDICEPDWDGNISKSFTDISGCRDLLIQDMMILHDVWDRDDSYNVIMSANGEQYHAVYPILNSVEKCETFMEFMSNLLPVSGIRLSRRRFGGKNSRSFIPYDDGFVRAFNKVKNVKNGLVLRFDQNFINEPMSLSSLSALLAILKEPKIVSKIVSGEISTTKDFYVSLVNLAKERLEGTDTSYNCLNLLEHYSYSCSNPFEALKMKNNDDGSDYQSMVFLALYFMMMNFSMDIHDDIDSGPVVTVESNMNLFGSQPNVLIIHDLKSAYKSLGIDLSFMNGNTSYSALESMEFFS